MYELLLSVIIWVLTCLGFGFLIDLFYPWKTDLIEGLIIRFGIGLCIWPIIGVLISAGGLDLNWLRCLLVAIIIFALAVVRRKLEIIPSIRSIRWQSLIVLCLVAISAFVYISGSYKYPWFEDSDPWEVAEASKFIGETESYNSPFFFNHFVDPYPQGYFIILGMIYQVFGSIYDTLKIFHNLIISFAVIFFYFFVVELTKNKNLALVSSIFLFAVPAFFSHFIYAFSFSIVIMILFLWASLKGWRAIAMLLYASIWVTQFYVAVIATVFLAVIYLSNVIVKKEFCKEYLQIGFGGLLISMAFWIPAYLKYIRFGLIDHPETSVGGIEVFVPYLPYLGILLIIGVMLYVTNKYWFPKLIKPCLIHAPIYVYTGGIVLLMLLLILPGPGGIKYVSGSGDAIYGFSDFFIAQGQGLFNNPIGIGFVIMGLFCLGVVMCLLHFNKMFDIKNLDMFIVFNLTLFTLIGVFGKSLSIGFIPFRMWVFFAIPCSILAAMFLINICDIVGNKWITIGLIALVCVGVYFTSFQQKYQLNTSFWPEHKLYSPTAIKMYYDPGLPKGTSLIGMCHPTFVSNSYDYESKPWISQEFADYYKIAMNDSIEENNKMYKRYNISYVIVDAGCANKFKWDFDKINQKVSDMSESEFFKPIKVSAEAVLYKVI